MITRKTKLILVIGTLLLLIGIIMILLVKPLTGKIIEGDIKNNYNSNEYIYTYTKALCDEKNFCQDYKISCNGNKTARISPITGAFIQHDENWQDPRDENNSQENLCE